MKTKIRIGFKSKNQLPYLMIIKEYYLDGRVEHASVIYQEMEDQSDVVFNEKPILVKEYRVERE